MKKSVKAVLLSGLIFPGLGQLYLRRWASGVLLSSVAAYAVYRIGSVVLNVSLDLTQKIESSAVPPDIETISHLVTQQLSGTEASTNMAMTLLGGSWLLGLIHAYWYGRAQDNIEMKSSHPEQNESATDS